MATHQHGDREGSVLRNQKAPAHRIKGGQRRSQEEKGDSLFEHFSCGGDFRESTEQDFSLTLQIFHFPGKSLLLRR